MTEQGFDWKRYGRWVGTFIGFPLAGVTARAVAGNIDAASAAAIGGLAGGEVLGAVQVGIAGIPAGGRARWIGGTAVGLAVGLTTGAATVGYDTDTASLIAMGALSGAGVGIAQAIALPGRLRGRVLWALATPVLWAGGWAITSQVIVDADRQHAVFGSSGALAVSLVAGVLYALQDRTATASSAVATVAASSDRMAA